MKSVTVTFKVYGIKGRRQEKSFEPSDLYDFSEGENVRVIEIINYDKTKTNNYSILRITRNTVKDCELELWHQITDGFFKNCEVGLIVEDI